MATYYNMEMRLCLLFTLNPIWGTDKRPPKLPGDRDISLQSTTSLNTRILRSHKTTEAQYSVNGTEPLGGLKRLSHPERQKRLQKKAVAPSRQHLKWE